MKATKNGHTRILQDFGSVVKMPISLKENICKESVQILNSILADTMTLRDLYKKHHWQASGPNFYSLHLLFDKHYEEQSELIDAIAGGISLAMAHDVASATSIPRPPMGREDATHQLSRLVQAHEIVLKKVRSGICKTSELGDEGSNDLLISQVLRTNEMQAWFVAEHLMASGKLSPDV